jgi:hypothetical protein
MRHEAEQYGAIGEQVTRMAGDDMKRVNSLSNQRLGIPKIVGGDKKDCT